MKYTITIESDAPLDLLVGQKITSGGIITSIKLENRLLSASELARLYNISTTTINRRLRAINRGSAGKMLFSEDEARAILDIAAHKKTVGRPRKYS